MYNIKFILNEESYTSKSSFLDNDFIPTYKKDNTTNYTFSGKRVYRGLYISKEGIKLNADVNGASNIIKKAVDTAFENIKDFSYLYSKIERINIY
jgi:transposase